MVLCFFFFMSDDFLTAENGEGFFAITPEQSMSPMVSMKGNGGRCIFGLSFVFVFVSSAAIAGLFVF